METIEIAGEPPITVFLRVSPRARRYSLRVSRLDGRVTLTLPKSASRARGIAFVNEKSAWIRGRLAERPELVPVGIGSIVPVSGINVTVAPGPRNGLELERGRLEIGPRATSTPRTAAMILKAHARDRITESADRFSRMLGRPFTQISLRDPRSRWGSCSANGRLMFSWRLILASSNVLDYVVAHEVAHLREMNHGPNFWATVERLWPSFQEDRAWLRAHGEELHRYRFDD